MEIKETHFEFTLPDFSEITPEGLRLLLEKVVRHNGIWKINKNDPDPFPSDPHADRVDAPEKLNLLNGEVYSKDTGKLLYKLPVKAMRFIHNEIMKCKEESIKSKLIAKRLEITYLK